VDRSEPADGAARGPNAGAARTANPGDKARTANVGDAASTANPGDKGARDGEGGDPATAETPAVGPGAPGARDVPEVGATGARQVRGAGARHADRAGRSPLADRPVLRHVALLAAFLVLGVVVTWPRPAYLVEGKLSATRDTEQYVWGFWWVAHQVTHLGNPFFTRYMAAPVGIQLGFHTLMPLPGLLLTPVTLAFGPSASLSLLTIVTPGLLCYAMYRAARLWLNAEIGAIVAGAFFGLSTIVAFQDWYHINIALGQLFLAVTLELVIRLRRRPCVRYGVVLGLVLGASFLVNQESTVMALLLAAGGLVPWFVRRPAVGRLLPLVLAVVIAAVVASPQLIAMAQQEAAGGSSATPALLIGTYDKFGADAGGLFAPSPRLTTFGLHGLATIYSYRQPDEGVPTFGLVLSVLAVAGLAAAWRRRSAWMLALLWLGGALLALGPTLVIGGKVHVPLPVSWDGTRMSLLMPYTWLVHVPGLSALREADRLALLGLVGAAMLAGAAVEWLRRHAKPLIAVVAVLGVLEVGWSGGSGIGVMATALPALDRPIAADHSGSIVLDVPFGLRGGIGLYGSGISRQALVLATADGHPRSVSYTSWIPARTRNRIAGNAFYAALATAQDGKPVSAAKLAAARTEVRRMNIGWVLVWSKPGQAVPYLKSVGFVFDYRADHVSVYRPAWK
jgi:4-amino-4-deoxy-L-arabinose transferase-like glycosyltransferase